jgi:murein L,D-transpeptidase YcbB/YkuD
MNRLILSIGLVCLILTPACAREERESARTESARTSANVPLADIQTRLASSPPEYVTPNDEDMHLWRELRRFYRLNGARLAWMDGARPTPGASVLIDAARHADREGLPPAIYDLNALAVLRTEKSRNPFKRNSLDPQQVVEADLRLTFMFLKYASHLVSGRVDPTGIDPHWFVNPRRVDLARLLQYTLDEGQVAETLQRLTPQHPQYLALRDALARHRAIAEKGGWPAVPIDLKVKKGGSHPQLALVRARLAVSGDLPPDPPPAPGTPRGAAAPPTSSRAQGSTAQGSPAQGSSAQGPDAQGPPVPFDAQLEAAVQRFQRRHGIKPDGALTPDTITAMNVPVEHRIRQIELNMERWRWLPEGLGDRHIMVNIPTYELEAFDHSGVVLRMKVVTGKRDSPTPIFMDQMTHVVFSPHWNVPPGIARNETLPAVLKDPGYLARNNLEIVKGSQVIDPSTIDWSSAEDGFDYRFRQKPGPRNSLGLVKFVFPNQFDVYLHDTPADRLFERIDRDFSHGCIRVEQPMDLARFVLTNQAPWTPEKIDAAMHSGDEQFVTLARPVPVYIVYKTAWVDQDGTTHFADDVYGHDATQNRLLDAAPDVSPPVKPVATSGQG